MRHSGPFALRALAGLAAIAGGVTLAAAAPAGRIVPAYDRVRKELRAIKIPILLPTWAGNVALEPPGPAFASMKKSSAPGALDDHHYDVSLSTTAGCQNDDDCLVVRIYAADMRFHDSLSDDDRVAEPVIEAERRKKAPPDTKPVAFDLPVNLARKLRGYYSAYTEEGRHTMMYVRFKRGNVVYDFGSPAFTRDELIRIVNSAIVNSPVRP